MRKRGIVFQPRETLLGGCSGNLTVRYHGGRGFVEIVGDA
jgi:hypothetical protein